MKELVTSTGIAFHSSAHARYVPPLLALCRPCYLEMVALSSSAVVFEFHIISLMVDRGTPVWFGISRILTGLRVRSWCNVIMAARLLKSVYRYPFLSLEARDRVIGPSILPCLRRWTVEVIHSCFRYRWIEFWGYCGCAR